MGHQPIPIVAFANFLGEGGEEVMPMHHPSTRRFNLLRHANSFGGGFDLTWRVNQQSGVAVDAVSVQKCGNFYQFGDR